MEKKIKLYSLRASQALSPKRAQRSCLDWRHILTRCSSLTLLRTSVECLASSKIQNPYSTLKSEYPSDSAAILFPALRSCILSTVHVLVFQRCSPAKTRLAFLITQLANKCLFERLGQGTRSMIYGILRSRPSSRGP